MISLLDTLKLPQNPTINIGCRLIRKLTYRTRIDQGDQKSYCRNDAPYFIMTSSHDASDLAVNSFHKIGFPSSGNHLTQKKASIQRLMRDARTRLSNTIYQVSRATQSRKTFSFAISHVKNKVTEQNHSVADGVWWAESSIFLTVIRLETAWSFKIHKRKDCEENAQITKLCGLVIWWNVTLCETGRTTIGKWQRRHVCPSLSELVRQFAVVDYQEPKWPSVQPVITDPK